mgnify:CR=1 FL=1
MVTGIPYTEAVISPRFFAALRMTEIFLLFFYFFSLASISARSLPTAALMAGMLSAIMSL